MTEQQEDRFAQLLQDNTSVNALLQQQAELGLTTLHRPLEQVGVLLSRPLFILSAVSLFLLWIAVNLAQKAAIGHTWDEPPFFWMQGVVSFLGLVITSIVLVSQARQGQIAEQRSQLQLQFALLMEQRSAKTVQLLEELRRDLPNVRDRVDEEAEVLQQVTSAEAILEALEILQDAPETALPPHQEPDEPKGQ